MASSKKGIAPHSAKAPEHCPYCGAAKLVRKGVRQKKLELGGGLPAAWKDSDHALTGHIDFLQVRNGFVHILDYKPDARTNPPIEQLTVYALALSHLAGVPLTASKCAWFNEARLPPSGVRVDARE